MLINTHQEKRLKHVAFAFTGFENFKTLADTQCYWTTGDAVTHWTKQEISSLIG